MPFSLYIITLRINCFYSAIRYILIDFDTLTSTSRNATYHSIIITINDEFYLKHWKDYEKEIVKNSTIASEIMVFPRKVFLSAKKSIGIIFNFLV